MKKHSILLLTNLKNKHEKEDIFLGKRLSKYFDVKISDFLSAEKYSKRYDIALIRNIWPTWVNNNEYTRAINQLRTKRIKTYNPLNAKGDLTGKLYLTKLYKENFPVTPSVKDLKSISKFGTVNSYFVKPLIGGDGYLCKKVNRKQLSRMNLKNFIIQPFIDFENEVQFYFIDKKLQYSLKSVNKHKSDGWKMNLFHPSKEDVRFANKFVRWNNLEYGIQRIDALRLKDGTLILNEIEDYCPYLSLLELKQDIREQFLRDLAKSIELAIKK